MHTVGSCPYWLIRLCWSHDRNEDYHWFRKFSSALGPYLRNLLSHTHAFLHPRIQDPRMESFLSFVIAMEVVFHCIGDAIARGKAVSFRGLSLVSRVATSIAVAAGQRLSLSEAVVVYFAATLDCRGEDSLSLADVDDEPATPPAPAPVSVRRSGRVRRAPAWHKDYIM
ncbi:uncharacterized protein [Argopecten irradians]|uniref:uncharacterized protein n=1 Tax=Argopecten irradians TaxID=31199 RepID=UPI00371C9580